jgi:hypothetical protein
MIKIIYSFGSATIGPHNLPHLSHPNKILQKHKNQGIHIMTKWIPQPHGLSAKSCIWYILFKEGISWEHKCCGD